MAVNKQAAARRRYDSTRRKEQGEQLRAATRARILDALVRTLARGPAALSVPAVAREAGVSVPTVYRYFPNKAALLDALSDYVGTRTALVPGQPWPRSPDELGDVGTRAAAAVTQLEETLRWAMASVDGLRARRELFRREVLPMVESALAEVAAEVPRATYERLRDVVVLLCSTHAIQFFDSLRELPPEEIGDRIRWGISALVAAARAEAG